MDTELKVFNEEGQEITIDVIDIFSVEGSEKEYILYAIDEDIYASILEEDNDSFSLKTIENLEENKIVNERINMLIS